MKLMFYNQNIVDEQMNLARNKEKSHFIFKHRLANGHICDVDVYSGLINFENKEVLYSIIHDRTDQNKAQTKLQDNEELFRLIFEQSPMGAYIMSLDFTTLNVNKTFCDMIGYSKQELSSLKFTEYTFPPDLELDLELRRQLIAGMIDEYSIEKRYICKDEKIIWGNVTVSAVKESEK